MSLRSKWIAWAWGVALAIPAVGLFLAGKFTDGLVSTGSFVLLFAYALVGIGYGYLTSSRPWGENEHELDRRAGAADQDEEQVDDVSRRS